MSIIPVLSNSCVAERIERDFLTFHDSTLPDIKVLLLYVLLHPLYPIPVLILLTLMDTEIFYTTSSLKETILWNSDLYEHLAVHLTCFLNQCIF